MVLLVATDIRPADARSYGWFFGAPEPRRRATRPHQRQTPQSEAPVADVPLPVPRPYFLGDPAPLGAQVAPAADTLDHAPKGNRPPQKLPGLVPKAPNPSSGLIKKDASPSAQVRPPAPMMPPPRVAGSGARLGEAPGQPSDDAMCPGRLKARGVTAEPIAIGQQPDVRCTVVEAVRLTALTLPQGGKVDFPDRPTVACTTADAFSLYVRDLLAPLARGTYGATVAAVWTGPGLECRSRDHIFGAKLSAHGQGLAVDIAQLKLSDGRVIEVGQPKTDVDQGFETAARAAGCGYFHTVLGPGSDSYHRTHWHFDLEVRGAKGDSKFCK